jgi:bidirectional [NiFe] hydrogenase diaphorase subunit
MTQLETKAANHPSGDNRFKLLDRAITKYHASGYALIEILHVAQGIFGFIENDLMVYIANALKLPLSRVYGVATFYHFFRLKPQGEHTFVLCTGTACYVKGATEIQKAVEHHCGCKFGETTKDNKVSLVSARCVGSCGLAPIAVLNDAVAGKMTPNHAVELIKQWQEEKKEVAV